MKSEKKSTLITLGVIFIIVFCVGFYTFNSINSNNKKGDKVPAATTALSSSDAHVYTDLNLNPVDLQQYKKNVRVVNSWATWSPLSAGELEKLERLAVEYKDKNVVVLAVNRKENPALVKKFLSKTNNYNNLIFILDNTDNFFKTVEGFAMPETIFYDSSGNEVAHYRGVVSYDDMKKNIEAILQ